jgi:uncharacterized protein (DUF4415 family)
MKKKKTKIDLSDYDDGPIDDPDNPEWTEEDFRRARPIQEFPELWPGILEAVERLRAKKRGRPKLDHPKVQVTLRLDEEVVNAFKEEGRGWQSKINDELKRTVRRRAKPRAARSR